MWAVWAAEAADYLEKLDDVAFTRGDAWPVDPNRGLVDMAHVRWATGNAVTAVDLCAATIGHLTFGSPADGRELSVRHFDSNCASRFRVAVERRRAGLTEDFLDWVDDTVADPNQRYTDVLSMRNPFTHSTTQRHVYIGRPGHDDRTRFQVRDSELRMNARELVVMSAEFAVERVRAFVDVVDGYGRSLP